MKHALAWTLMLSGIYLTALPANGQAGSALPVIETVEWRIFRNLLGVQLLAPPVPFNSLPAFDPAVDQVREFDVLVARVTVRDPDFTDEGGDNIFFLQQAVWVPVPGYPAPEPPPVPQGGQAFQPEEGEGLAPGAGQVVVFEVAYTIPEYLGANQARLRGDINYDVAFVFVIAVSNEQAPEGCTFGDQMIIVGCVPTSPVDIHGEFIFVVENPALRPPNPPAFADAGADMMVAAGSTVELDGSRTFDGFNIGFNPLDPNVFERDDLEFTWEWIGGPARVDPIVRDPVNAPAIAEVTLNDIGTYSYRLFVDDGANPTPTSDSVVVQVVSSIPENRAPRAVITRPPPAIVVGSIITLDGTGSTDPDGDPLSFRWRQTDELGGTLSTDDLTDVFQPLGGIETPISMWQAIKPGTYHFRLLVSDGRVEDSARVDIVVVEAGTLGISLVRPDGVVLPPGAPRPTVAIPAPAPQPTSTPNQVVPLCGGGLLPLAVVPLALGLMRGRRR